MNIEIADRLVALRKESGYSQEALATKLGISRQAVSKWERAEASPDTDNLIALSRLYGISIDRLLNLNGEEEKQEQRPAEEEASYSTENFESFPEEEVSAKQEQEEDSSPPEREYVKVYKDGISVSGKRGAEIRINDGEIFVNGGKVRGEVKINSKGIFVNGENVSGKEETEKNKRIKIRVRIMRDFPISLIIVVAYLFMGLAYNLWHPGWLMFLFIPIIYSAITAIEKRNASIFAYPVFAALVFLSLGFFFGLWKYAWLIFLTIPIFYSLCRAFKRYGEEDKNK
jgi:transcriptional regulator with XRE-family HTH domain